MLLKRELGPKSWPIGADVDADLQRRGSGFLARRCNSRICGEFSSKFSLHERHVCTTIGPRSRRDRATIMGQSTIASFQGSLPKLGEMIPPSRNHDRGSIAPRSRSDRAAIVEFFH